MSLPFSTLLQHNTKGTDVGGTLGLDIAFGTGSSQLVLDLHYTRMMSEFDEAPYDEVYSRKHSALSIQVGVSISPSAGSRGRTRRSLDEPPESSILIMSRITREDIATRDENLSVYDIIRLERPGWMDGAEVRATFFVDGEPWDGSPELQRNRRWADVEEVRRIEAGAPGVYEGHGVVIEMISRGGVVALSRDVVTARREGGSVTAICRSTYH